MTFRTRLTLVSMAGVAVAVILASAVIYVVARSQLRGQVDDALRLRFGAVSYRVFPGGIEFSFPPLALGAASGYAQVVDTDGDVTLPPGADITLPVDSKVRAVAAGQERDYFQDVLVNGTHVRVLTAHLGRGLAVQLARPLDEVDKSLHRLGLILLVVGLGGIALAAGLGALVVRTALAPVRRLTEATEHVTSTTDLTRRIDVHGSDELSRLAVSFNAMLEALEGSLKTQRQLVADASHELRTPITSIRTNIEVLARSQTMPEEERARVFQDVVAQLEELTVLVRDLMELARGAELQEEAQDVRLDEIVERAVERARRFSPRLSFAMSLEPSLVRGVPSSLERAVGNLLDNAAKWSPEGGEVEVSIRDGEVMVRDHGPGIADADLPFVFDRFYRAPSARGRPGSGLGLAIVRQVAKSHGGSVLAETAPGGGALLRLRLPQKEVAPSL